MTSPADFVKGDKVVYNPRPCHHELGTVTSTNERFVFVCYGEPGTTSQATNPEELMHQADIVDTVLGVNWADST